MSILNGLVFLFFNLNDPRILILTKCNLRRCIIESRLWVMLPLLNHGFPFRFKQLLGCSHSWAVKRETGASKDNRVLAINWRVHSNSKAKYGFVSLFEVGPQNGLGSPCWCSSKTWVAPPKTKQSKTAATVWVWVKMRHHQDMDRDLVLGTRLPGPPILGFPYF